MEGIVNKSKQAQQRRQFEKNWNAVRKSGGPIYYETAALKPGKEAFIELSIKVEKGNKTAKTVARIVLEHHPIKDHIAMVGTCEASVVAIIKKMGEMAGNVQLAYKAPTRTALVLVAQKLLKNACEMFGSVKASKDSTLTIRLTADQAGQIKQAGARCGLKVSTKILLFALKYYLLQTAEDENIKIQNGEDPAD